MIRIPDPSCEAATLNIGRNGSNVEGIDIREEPQMKDQVPSGVTLEGSEPNEGFWPEVNRSTPVSERVVYPGAGSELFHGKKQ